MSRPRRLGAGLLAPVLATLLAAAGCDPTAGERPSAAGPPPATPESSFERFLTTLQRAVDDPALRAGNAIASYGSAPGAPLTEWTTTIEHEYLPATAEHPPRAVVLIKTESVVTVVLPESGADDEEDAGSTPASPGGDPKPGALAEFEALAKPSPGVAGLGSSAIKTLPDEQLRRVELEYRGGRWELLTELNDVDEPFTSSAVRHALRRQ